MTAMLPAALDLNRVRGDDFPFTITIKIGGTALDITGFGWVLSVDTLEEPPDNTTLVFSMAGVVTDGPAGKVTFSPTTLNAATAPGEYFYDLQGTDGSGKKRTYAKGKYTVVQDITKV